MMMNAGVNLQLVMRKHWQAKKQLREFRQGKNNWCLADVKTIQEHEKEINNLENMLLVFIPKNFLQHQLNK